MILQDTKESVDAAKAILGIPPEERVGFIRRAAGYEPYIQLGGREWGVGDEVLPTSGKAPADYFDVFGEFPLVVPVSVDEAVRQFREHIIGYRAEARKLNAELKAGTSSAAIRKKAYEESEVKLDEIKLRLFRSIMAAPAKGDLPA